MITVAQLLLLLLKKCAYLQICHLVLSRVADLEDKYLTPTFQNFRLQLSKIPDPDSRLSKISDCNSLT